MTPLRAVIAAAGLFLFMYIVGFFVGRPLSYEAWVEGSSLTRGYLAVLFSVSLVVAGASAYRDYGLLVSLALAFVPMFAWFLHFFKVLGFATDGNLAPIGYALGWAALFAIGMGWLGYVIGAGIRSQDNQVAGQS